MFRKFRRLLALAILGGALPTATTSAQAPAPSSDQKSGQTAPAFDPLPGFPHPPDAPPSLMKPAPTAQYGCADQPEPYFVHDPLLDPPDYPQPGWFFDAEVGAAGPHIKGVQTNAGAPPGTIPNVIFLPAAGLDWTVAPRLQAGYRLPSAFGEFALSYRGLGTDGTDTTAGLDGPAALRTRLDFSQIDADYLSREFSLLPYWDMKWHFGVRLAYLYYDSQADEPTALAAAGSTVFEQRFTNSYWGIGPHAGVELQRKISGTGLSFVGSIDGATLLGRIRQGFFEDTTLGGSLADHYSGSQDVPIVNFQAGVAWKPSQYPQTQLFVGYEYEYWWNIGKISNDGTAAELSVNEIVIRLSINF